MAVRSRSLFFLILLSLFALFLVATLAKEDPHLKQCSHQCKYQAQFTGEERRQCERSCEEHAREKQTRDCSEQQRRTRGGEDEEWGINNYDSKRLEECLERCEQQGEQQQKREGWQREKVRCRERCETRYGRRNLRRKEEYPRWGEEGWDEEEEFGWEESRHPYVFERHDFETKFETESGKGGVLPRFGKRSKLLKGIDDFRLGFLEIEPHAFMVPQHTDADGVLFVVKGNGTFSVLEEDEKDKIDIKEGDILRIRAGSPAYLVNSDSNEKLQIVKLFKPVNTPGHFEIYHGTSGRDRESFYTAFSLDVLEAALKTDRQSLEEVFGQQRHGSVVQASKEQVEALSGVKQKELSLPFRIGESKGSKSSQAFNIFGKKPFKSNKFGQLHVVDAGDLKGLKDLDVAVSFANITRGAMFGPYFNSRATKLCLVPEDEGYFEMACPHLSSRKFHHHRHHGGYGRGDREFGRGEGYGRGDREFGRGERYGRGEREFGRGDSRTYRHHKQGRVQTYQTVRSRLHHGTMFIIPAGHPVVSVASQKNNLQIVCFEVNAENNVRYPLAGKKNIISLMDKEAKELAFDFPSSEVDQVFGNQDKEFFFPGPGHQQERRGRGRAAA